MKITFIAEIDFANVLTEYSYCLNKHSDIQSRTVCIRPHGFNYKIQQVKSVTWEVLINEYSIEAIDFLKIDTEGHDHIILNEYYNECIKKPSLLANKILFEMNVLSNQIALNKLILNFKELGYHGTRYQDDYELIRDER